MLAGPSSAGKTTTSMILRRSFEAMGRQAVKVSLDDFFSLPKKPRSMKTASGISRA